MTALKLSFPPSANRYWRVFRGHPVKSKDAKAYQEKIGWECRAAGLEPLTGDVAVELHIFRPNAGRDLDNCAKVLLDALQGYAFLNDKQIADLHLIRDYDPEGVGYVWASVAPTVGRDSDKLVDGRKPRPKKKKI